MAPDYPLDLYYLMDVSNSMYGDKNNLVSLAGSLASESKNVYKYGKDYFPSVT